MGKILLISVAGQRAREIADKALDVIDRGVQMNRYLIIFLNRIDQFGQLLLDVLPEGV